MDEIRIRLADGAEPDILNSLFNIVPKECNYLHQHDIEKGKTFVKVVGK